MHRIASVVLVLGLAACGSQPPSGTTGATTGGSAVPTGSAVSVICEAFETGGPVDLTTEAVIANMRGESTTALAREAINGYEDLAERASGEERDDLLSLATTMDDAEVSGDGVNGWNAASEAFYVKYAEQCGAEVAP